MSGGWKAWWGGSALALAFVATGMPAGPAEAQDERLRRVEAEVRALQRAVFPDGDGRFFTPEVVPGQQAQPQQPVGTPPTTVMTDILARLATLEAQLARLTASSEESAYEVAQMEERLAALEAAAAAPPPPPVMPVGRELPPSPTGVIPLPEGASPPPPQVVPPQATAAPSAERIAAVQAIPRPSTGDAGDDEYVYGFRLWEAGYYPEAQQQLALFVERYPDHSRVTFGRNLLGRAFLDNGQPRDAATHFFENYQTDRHSARAPDSLLFLSEAMIALNDINRACIALAEFGETYPALATGRLREQYDINRARVTCE